MLMFTSKSWTEKRSVVFEDSSAGETSAGLVSAVDFVTGADDSDPTAAAAVSDICCKH